MLKIKAPRKALFSVSCAAIVLTAGAPAFAQNEGAPEAEAQDDIPEILVTARRREENAQDVPAAVQVLSAAALTQRGVLNESDLQTVVPGLLVRTNNNQSQLNYVMRGESFEPYSGSVPGVQPYVNDVALSGNAAPPFYDLQNVQVLKGPQGTLFGRNSTGGAVLYTTRRPGSEFGGFASIQYGRFDRFVAEAALDVPIVSDVLAVRFAGTYQSGGAYVRNLYDNALLGDSEVKSGRVTVELTPAAGITNTTIFSYGEYEAINVPKRISYVAPCGVGSAHPCWVQPGNAFFQSLINSPAGTYFPGWPNGNIPSQGYVGLIAYLDAAGKYTVSANGTGINRATDTMVVNTTAIELSDNLTVKNIFGYSRTKRRSQTDSDNSPFPFLQTGGTVPGDPLEGRDSRSISNELQLQGEAFGGRLNYIVGGFYSDTEFEYDSPNTGLTYNPTTDSYSVFSLRYRAKTTDRSYALFTQGTYKLTDRLSVTAGIRKAWDDLSILHLQNSIFAGTPRKSTKVGDISWTFSLDYKATPDLLLYATTRGSWRVGGYNPFVPTGSGADNTQTAATGGNYFPPQTVRDVEFGFKFDGQIGGMPVRLNSDFFYVWAKNIEKTGTTVIGGRVTSTTLSVPAGEIWGLETEAMIKPASWLTFSGNATYNVGTYTDREAVIFGVPVVYNTFPDTPKFSGTLNMDITHELAGNAGTLRYHADIFGQTSFHLTSFGDTFVPGDTVPGYVIANMRLDWQNPLGTKGITASVFLKNVTDKLYFTGGGGGVQANGTNSLNLGQPRTYGFVLRAEF